ncbi:hypothetical protein [Sphingosinithalassobacter portus]|uniref:hypothetical protein n=1 Tax=Stakelama portus TaxID=2676234 RepID=UPI0011AB88FF|nr:hypothetical protein [Sphingosinithalassobacter portus]
MPVRLLCIAMPLALLCACSAADPIGDTANAAEAPGKDSPAPGAAAAVAADAPIDRWIVGTWSFDAYCGSSDFAVVYAADGSVDNGGQQGRWTLDGDTVTETIEREIDQETGTLTTLSAPITRSYTVERRDASHGVLRFEGNDIPILRC